MHYGELAICQLPDQRYFAGCQATLQSDATSVHQRSVFNRFPINTLLQYSTHPVIHSIKIRTVIIIIIIIIKRKLKAQINRNKKAVLSQRWPRDARYISRSWAVAEIWPFEIIQDSGGRHLEFVRTGNSAVRSAVPENPTQEPNMKWIRSPVAFEIWPFSYLGGIWNPILGEGEVVGGQRWHLRKSDGSSYRLSIVTVALSVTIRPQFAIECLRRWNRQGGGWL